MVKSGARTLAGMLAGASLLLLSACGGGDGASTGSPSTGSNPGPAPTSSPAPTPTPTPTPAPSVAIEAGVGSFTFSNWAGPAIPVHYYRPATVTADTRILIVFHGTSRTAENYRDAWVQAATEGKYIVLAPEFAKTDFPDSLSYQEGYVMDEMDRLRPRELWTFAAVEPLFDAVRQSTGTKVPSYALYGHSGGAQFLHRFLMLMPEARYSKVIAANAGWYTLPQLPRDYPVALGRTPVDAYGLSSALKRPMIILLGTEDTDPNDPTLPTGNAAMEQGPNRLERGRYFYARAQETAAQFSVSLAWRIEYVAGVGHDNRGMVEGAKTLLWN